MTRTCTDIHIDACKGAVRCGPGPRWIRVDMGREFFFFFLLVCVELITCV